MANYRRVIVTIRLGGRLHGKIRVARGINQGRPMSGTFWAIAFDGVIRFLQAVVTSVPASLTVYADDIAIAAAQLVEAGRRTFRALDVVSPAIGTELNAKKTMTVACYPHDADADMVSAQLVVAEPRAGAVVVCGSAATHFGVLVGLAAPPGAWKVDIRSIAERSRRIKAAGRSPMEAWAIHRTYAAPLSAYRLQDRPLDAALRLSEEASIATATSLLMRAVLVRVMAGLRSIGNRVPVRTFDHVSVAARSRRVVLSGALACRCSRRRGAGVR